MEKIFKLNEKEVNYIIGNLMSEYSILKHVKSKNHGNVIGIDTLTKEEKDRMLFLESFLKKVQKV